MSISTLITEGLGSFGDVPHIVLLGLDTGGVSPPTPPDVPTIPTFGGGPFTHKYGYYGYGDDDEDEALEDARAVRDALPGEQAEQIEEAISSAVEALRSAPDPVMPVLDAEKLYRAVIQGIRGQVLADVREALEMGRKQKIETDRIEAMWQAEVKRRLRDEEDRLIVSLVELDLI